MVIVASVYLRFYIEVGVGVGTFLPTPTPSPPNIPSDSDSDSTALASENQTNTADKVSFQNVVLFKIIMEASLTVCSYTGPQALKCQ
jgi:hypothetical protein